MSKLRDFPIHPLLLGIYPVLALLAYNLEEIRVEVGVRAVMMTFFAVGLLYLAIRLLSGDRQRAALLYSLGLVLFFSYGHVYLSLRQWGNTGDALGRHRFLLPFWLLLFGLGAWLVLRRLKGARRLTETLNAISLIAVLLPLATIASFSIGEMGSKSNNPGAPSLAPANLSAEAVRPDVYYIILDGYSRDDTLKELFDLDNSEFLKGLEERGFYVAQCSRSNYAVTKLSLASSLNMSYTDELLGEIEDPVELLRAARGLVKENAVRDNFRELGYTSYAFETGFYWTEWESADFYLSRRTESELTASNWGVFLGLNHFEVIYINTTAGRALLDLAVQVADKISTDDGAILSFDIRPLDLDYRQRKYEMMNYILDRLPELAAIPGPKFVFAHLLVTHDPFVFTSNGEFQPEYQQNKAIYREQVAFINAQILEIIDAILDASDSPPVIILQADHGGPGLEERPVQLNILNAYHLPYGADQRLYPFISPVNTFRLLFDTYFGADYGLLADVNYFSPKSNYADFSVYPEERSGCEPGEY